MFYEWVNNYPKSVNIASPNFPSIGTDTAEWLCEIIFKGALVPP